MGRNSKGKELPIKRVGLMVNSSKWEALQFASEVIAWLTERDLEVMLDPDAATVLGRDDIAWDTETFGGLELLLTLGGDGTILAASHIAAPLGIPILGVHMGRFGFITETHPQELLARLDVMLEGEMHVEDRMMVQGDVIREGEVVFSAVGLNEVVMNKGTMARTLHLRTSIGGDFVATYPADGVIVSTPTGSTAYALSAGGPLVEPTVQALLVVPIAPHTLAARPITIPPEETVSVTIESDGGEALFAADSTQICSLVTGDQIEVRKAEYSTRIVTFGKSSFYGKVRKRLLWGERLNM
jgi:NAD+ kinase